jgi:four helix bundle protein
MSKIVRFEEIEGWQSARTLVNDVYALTNSAAFRKDTSLRDQLRRAAVSVMSNIAEGFESQSSKTFIRYLYIAKGSAGEIRSQLYICLDQDYIKENEFAKIQEQALQCSRLLSGFIKYLERYDRP